MKILAGGPIRQRARTLQAHLDTMEWQTAECDYLFINDLDPDWEDYTEARDVLFDHPARFRVVNSPIDRPSGAEYVPTEQTTIWQKATFPYLGALRQQMLQTALEEDYDYLFMADSDLLLDPYTVEQLARHEMPVVSAVFWTQWQQGSPYQPQVWLRHPYGLSGMGMEEHEFLGKLSKREMVPVLGLGACTLFNVKAVMEKGLRYFPLLEGLPEGGMWQGEDRTFSILANRMHVPLMADAWPDVFHVYRPSDEEYIDTVKELLNAPRQTRAKIGDLVCATLTPLQEPELSKRNIKVELRGRLGTMELLPELEYVLTNMDIGDQTIIPLSFPSWYPAKPYRGEQRLIRVQLHDIKPNQPHIGLPGRIVGMFDDRYYTPDQLKVLHESR